MSNDDVARNRYERMRAEGLIALRQRGWTAEAVAWVELYSRWTPPTRGEVEALRDRFS